MLANTTCQHCGLPVRWCVNAINGKRLAVDPDPVPDGNMWIDHIDHGTPVMQAALHHDDVPRKVPFTYVNHALTCGAEEALVGDE